MSADGGSEDGDRMARLLASTHEELSDFIRRRAWRSLLHLESAEDLVQGVVARALNFGRDAAWPEDASFRAWLFDVAGNYMTDRRRYWNAMRRGGCAVLRLSFGNSTDPGLVAVRDLAASVTGPSTFASRREQLTLAARALSLLLPRDRE